MSERTFREDGAPIPWLPAADVRQRFLDFFAERGHTVVPSASLVPAGDQTLLFTNSGMVQFKGVLTGAETRSYKRAVDVQRCLRVAGKHNDFEEVGRTPRHHTFFEMLGNWSFGDYFKREAIHWAWELLTQVYGIPPDRLAATTYTDDEEAWAVWRDEIGLPPERMAKWGNVEARDDKNFWRMADVGPCGPCSEIHYDRGAHLSEGPHCIPDHSEHCPRWLEIWNLVFMEFDQQPDGPRVPLPFKSVDTGLGLERLASVVQGVATNYDTDLFTPIHDAMRQLLGHDPEQFENERFSYQVIADHVRAVTFLIADGVRPSNEGRGYVLRRILRRAVRHGRLLGRTEPFLADLSGVVVETMANAYPYLEERRDEIRGKVLAEERQFQRTLDAGTIHFEEALISLTGAERRVGRSAEELPADAPLLPGGVAFRLHDTYGFPIDLTVELAAEYGVRVDRAGYEAALAEQRERSRGGKKAELARHAGMQQLYEQVAARAGAASGTGEAHDATVLTGPGPTKFLGYETTSAEGRVVAILRDGTEYERLAAVPEIELRHQASAEAEVVLDQTPFYAEGGGQIGDRGVLRTADGSVVFTVEDTQRPAAGLIVHRGTLHGALAVGETLRAEVDAERRARTMRNHTATHVLHRALRNTVGESARQQGSLVTPDYLRFDYPSDRPLTDEEKRVIEAEVRRVVRDDKPVEPRHMTMTQAMEAGADAFFDEKYGEQVRVVFVDGYSRELCGGTHCHATGQIGNFFITAERSIGSGMRRIEAVTGEAAETLVAERFELLERLAAQVGARSLEAVPERVAELQERTRELERRLRQGGASGRARPAELARGAEALDGTRFLAYAAPFESMKELQGFAREVRTELGEGVIVLALEADEPQLFVTVSQDLVSRGVSAGVLVGAGAALMDGRGGGKPEMAQARGTRRDRLPSALAAIRQAVAEALAGGDGRERPPDSTA
ncbi:MAG TPA: alanine--tRNA ligase [Candidatus Limnocylindria bacterium]|nr:alanine--tRNA ligase [Candidatus Limnocylindria bacterium]